MKINGKQIELSHTDKELFPGISKGELIEYYEKIGDFILPYLKNRPLTLQIFPKGIDEDGFFQKNIPDYYPDYIERAHLPRQEKEGKIDMVICNNKETLIYLANHNAITLHLWLSLKDKPQYPDHIIFDLDPSGSDFKRVKRAAKDLRELLEEDLNLHTFVMTTGSKGLHIYVPIKREHTYDTVKDFAKTIAEIMEHKHLDLYTTKQRKDKRGDKLFIDYLRNEYAQTGVCPYSVRSKEGAPVATPLSWDEVASLDDPQKYTIKNLFRRLSQKDDPWKTLKKSKHSISKAMEQAEKMLSDLNE